MDTSRDPIEQVLRYHDRSKHHLQRYARSLGYMDWASQPNPFRRYAGARVHSLPLAPTIASPSYDALFDSTLPVQHFDRTSVSWLLYHSLALSAWKKAEWTDPWSLRVNPSSGDLHPTEAYLICGSLPELSDRAAVYHYAVDAHALEERMNLADEDWRLVVDQLPSGAFLLGLSSVYWREAWKYGERAYRYCQHDCGHAIAAVAIAARALGWEVRLVETVGDAHLSLMLGIGQQTGPEAEHPDCLLAVFPADVTASATDLSLPEDWYTRLAATPIAGTPNRLSTEHHPWPVIDEVAAACRHPGSGGAPMADAKPHIASSRPIGHMQERHLAANRIIRQRRSAVDMDGRTALGREAFYAMLLRTAPATSAFPSCVLPWQPQVALAIFVHRVEGLSPGLYLLVRDKRQMDALRAQFRADFQWMPAPALPPDLELFRLLEVDTRAAAKLISCHQDIAADGAFSLGMIARLGPALRERGAYMYPRLFWETGLIGQVLYLEAEAAGVRATGIGCFFDDAMHEVLGIADHGWQSLYHFTVGGAVEDTRLQTLDAYAHLAEGGAVRS